MAHGCGHGWPAQFPFPSLHPEFRISSCHPLAGGLRVLARPTSWSIVCRMDALTFLAVIQDVRKVLLGARVQSVQAAGLHGLWLELATPGGPEALLLSANEAFPRLSRGAARPAKGGAVSPLAGAARRALPGSCSSTLLLPVLR